MSRQGDRNMRRALSCCLRPRVGFPFLVVAWMTAAPGCGESAAWSDPAGSGAHGSGRAADARAAAGRDPYVAGGAGTGGRAAAAQDDCRTYCECTERTCGRYDSLIARSPFAPGGCLAHCGHFSAAEVRCWQQYCDEAALETEDALGLHL